MGGHNVIAEYSNRPQTSPGGRKFYHPDRLSNRLITDNSGVVKGALDILPFGDEGGRSGESEKHRLTSYERDRESGTDYAVNRQYSQVTGRFNRPDPVGGDIAQPQSLNRYAYVQNDSVNGWDPLGLDYCPPQYQTCGKVVVDVDGVLYEVNVGYNGGHGTFLWGQLSIMAQGSLASQIKESRLPEGFDIYIKSLVEMVFEKGGSITDQARTQTRANIQKQIDDCTKIMTGVLTGKLAEAQAERQMRQLMGAAGKQVVTRLVRYALRKGLESGFFARVGSKVLIGARFAHSGLTLLANPAVVVPGIFIGASILMAPGSTEMQLQNQIWEERRKCAEAVYQKYRLN